MQLETREGPKYQTGMGLESENPNVPTSTIPPPTVIQKEVKIEAKWIGNHHKIVFDLETSSRDKYTSNNFIYLISHKGKRNRKS